MFFQAWALAIPEWLKSNMVRFIAALKLDFKGANTVMESQKRFL